MFLREKILGIKFNRQHKVLAFHYVARDKKGTDYLEKFEIKDGHCNINDFSTFAKNCLKGAEPADFSTEESTLFCREIYEFARKKVATQFKDDDNSTISYASNDSSAALFMCGETSLA